MAAIDTYIGYLTKFKASAIILESGKQVVVRLATGDRPATATVTLQALQAIVEECAPPDAFGEMLASGSARFDYTRGPRPVTCTVEATSTRMRIVIAAAESAADAAPIEIEKPPAPSARSAARTQHTDSPTMSQARDGGIAFQGADAGVAPPGPPPVAPAAAIPLVPLSEPRAPAGGATAAAAPAAMPVEARAAGGGAAIDEMLRAMKKLGASDLHLSCSMPPLVRLHGEMKPIPGFPELTPDRMLELLHEICPEKNRKEFEERHDTDFAYEIAGLARFRANVFRDRKGPGGGVPRHPVQDPHRRAARPVAEGARPLLPDQGPRARHRARPAPASRRRSAR